MFSIPHCESMTLPLGSLDIHFSRQGKQNFPKSIKGKQNFPKSIKDMFLHSEFTSNTGTILIFLKLKDILGLEWDGAEMC